MRKFRGWFSSGGSDPFEIVWSWVRIPPLTLLAACSKLVLFAALCLLFIVEMSLWLRAFLLFAGVFGLFITAISDLIREYQLRFQLRFWRRKAREYRAEIHKARHRQEERPTMIINQNFTYKMDNFGTINGNVYENGTSTVRLPRKMSTRTKK